MAYDTIIYTVENGIGTITLNRPDSYNAANEQLTTDLKHALDAATVDDTVPCVVLTGACRAFCSGQDLKDAPGGDGKRSLSDSLERRYNPIIKAITSMSKPVIAGINGVAAGAGLSLALACDVRVMSGSAKFVEAFAAIALIPDSGATWFYPRMLGYAKAFEFATLNAPITAEEALRLGMVNSVVHPKAFASTLVATAEKYASGPTQTYGFVKMLLQQGITSTLDDMLELEKEFQQKAGESEDYKEGVAAFIEKRKPKFTGS